MLPTHVSRRASGASVRSRASSWSPSRSSASRSRRKRRPGRSRRELAAEDLNPVTALVELELLLTAPVVSRARARAFTDARAVTAQAHLGSLDALFLRDERRQRARFGRRRERPAGALRDDRSERRERPIRATDDDLDGASPRLGGDHDVAHGRAPRLATSELEDARRARGSRRRLGREQRIHRRIREPRAEAEPTRADDGDLRARALLVVGLCSGSERGSSRHRRRTAWGPRPSGRPLPSTAPGRARRHRGCRHAHGRSRARLRAPSRRRARLGFESLGVTHAEPKKLSRPAQTSRKERALLGRRLRSRRS